MPRIWLGCWAPPTRSGGAASYQDTTRDYLKCDNRAVEAEARFAREGQEITARMAMHYFPKKPD